MGKVIHYLSTAEVEGRVACILYPSYCAHSTNADSWFTCTRFKKRGKTSFYCEKQRLINCKWNGVGLREGLWTPTNFNFGSTVTLKDKSNTPRLKERSFSIVTIQSGKILFYIFIHSEDSNPQVQPHGYRNRKRNRHVSDVKDLCNLITRFLFH